MKSIGTLLEISELDAMSADELEKFAERGLDYSYVLSCSELNTLRVAQGLYRLGWVCPLVWLAIPSFDLRQRVSCRWLNGTYQVRELNAMVGQFVGVGWRAPIR